MNHWIGVVSLAHVRLGVAGGFAQMNHGSDQPLRRMQAGDGLVFYSPRQRHPDGAPLRAFTAIGRIRDAQPRLRDLGQEVAADFVPWCIEVDYWPSQVAPIEPLLGRLGFIPSLQHWGSVFRYGHLRITEADFLCIAEAMQARPDGRALPPPVPQGELF